MDMLVRVDPQFSWSFRQVHRPFSGELKAHEMQLACVSDHLKTFSSLISALGQGHFEIDSGRLEMAKHDVWQALLRLDNQCLKTLAQDELLLPQRLTIASLLHCSGSFRNVVNCFQRLGERLIVIRDQHPPAALRELG